MLKGFCTSVSSREFLLSTYNVIAGCTRTSLLIRL